MRHNNPHIDIYEDVAVIYLNDAEYELPFCKSEVEQWAKTHIPDAIIKEKDPDDGLSTWYLGIESYSEAVEEYVKQHQGQWKQVRELITA